MADSDRECASSQDGVASTRKWLRVVVLPGNLKSLGSYALLLVALVRVATAQAAEPSVFEIEPNDTPDTALDVTAPITLIGTMSGRDQDAFNWIVSDVDASKRWTLELHGIPGRLTIIDVVRIAYNAAGEAAGANTLFKMGTRDGSLPSIHADLIFEPGEYLLGFAQAGGGSAPYRPPQRSLNFGEDAAADVETTPDAGGYRLHIRAAGSVSRSSKRTHDSQANAAPVRLNSEQTVFLESTSSWYRIEFADDASRWDIDVQVPVARKVRAQLTRADGERLSTAISDEKGRLKFADLALPSGAYFVQVEPELKTGEAAGFVQTLRVTGVGQRVAGEEAEPNNSWELANRIEWDGCCTGRLSENGDADLFSFALDEASAGELQELSLDTASDQPLQLCLLSAEGRRIQCRTGTGRIVLGDLLLPSGEYGFSVDRGRAGIEYTISVRSAGAPQPGRETEPNDTLPYATGTPSTNRIAGRFDSPGDVDFYKFVLTDEPQLWRVQVIGEHLQDVTYHDAAGDRNQRIRAQPNQQRVRLDNLFLLPGTHHFSVSGRAAGDYTLLARAIGPPDPNGEMEPNDDVSRMQLLRMGQTRTGLLSDPGDIDYYRFHLADWDHIRLTATPPADGQIQAHLYFNGGQLREHNAGGTIVAEGLFPPGDYHITLRALRTPSDAEYKLQLERLDRFQCPADCEPNDNAVFANPVPPTRIVQGRSGGWRGNADWYLLPESGTARTITLQFDSKPAAGVDVFDANEKPLAFPWDDASSSYRGELPATGPNYIRVSGQNAEADYTMTVLFDGENAPKPLPALPVTLSLALEATEVAAYERVGQSVSGILTVQNSGAESLDLAIEWAVSDARWRLVVEKTLSEVPGGDSQDIPVRVAVPHDAWADIPVRLSVQAETADGRSVSTFTELSTGRDAAPVNPVHAWAVPEALRSGLNVALTAFGATAESPHATVNDRLGELFDGVAAIGPNVTFRAGRGGPAVVTVDLPGERAIAIAGFALNPTSARTTHLFPRDVAFELSADGAHFETVAKGKLNATQTEQFFVLDAPIEARFARLVLLSNWHGERDGAMTLGEWKVIAEPGFDPFLGAGLNIADPALGGHVSWAKPRINAGWDDSVLTEKKDAPSVRVPPDQPFEWVVGFHHNRVASIERLEWRDSNRTGRTIERVSLSASLDSPIGPWQPLAEWSRAATGDVLELASPTWVRYLRFSVPATDAGGSVDAPEMLTIREQPTGVDYRSVQSEWGFDSQSGFYESTQAVPMREGLSQRGNESRSAAAALSAGVTESGAVQLGRQIHWYRPVLAPGHNTAIFTLTGDPTVRSELVLTDAAGQPILLRKRERESTSGVHVFEAALPPGADTFIELREPPRNVLFLWDTSASVGPFRQVIYNSLTAYAEDLVPGRDTANFLPFGASRPLLRDWYGEPYLLQTILNDFPRSVTSSSAEHTQYYGARALAARAGTKAIVMVTDASTPRRAEMWDAYKEVQPRVFTLKVSSNTSNGANTMVEEDLMQDWSRVNGGHYAYLSSEGEMAVAFDRAATLLRRPAHYTLTLATEQREAPGPGTLQVVAGSGARGAVATSAVELILDASGSMLQRMEGRRRIDIAKDVLSGALREHIPAGTPTALRVFGHRTPNACETDLEIPLQPLDMNKAIAQIVGIEAKNLARTPIAASLAEVAKDLGKAGTNAVVVLVTDGEETCDGDPAAEIEKLAQAGFAISLNIVGFAIDDDALAAQFESWAEAGGGRYFAANDAAGLNDAVTQALATPYTVYDRNGEPVAEGSVGGAPVEVEQGVYRVVVGTVPPRVFKDVEVPGEKSIRLEL
jgi:hypothetical protein